MGIDTRQLIFILGAPRSGTTLMYGMLLKDQASMGGVRMESFLYNRSNTLPYSLEALEKWKYMRTLIEEAGLDPAALLARHSTWFGVFAEAALVHQQQNGYDYFVEKSPIHTAWYKEIARDFPGSKWIIIGRKAAANIHSLAYTRKVWFNLGVDKLPWGLGNWPSLRYWNAAVRYFYYWRIMKVAATYPNCLTYVQYEDVVSNPEAFRQELIAKLGVQLNPLMPIVPSGSSTGAAEKQAFHTSQIDAYRSKMPGYAQYMSRVIFEPAHIMDKMVGVVLRLGLMYPGFWYKRWMDGRRKERS